MVKYVQLIQRTMDIDEESSKTTSLRQKIRNEVKLRGTEIPFLIFITFLFMFISVRSYVWLLNIPENSPLQLDVFGYRIHHYWFGILFICFAGWMAINHRGRNVDRTAAILYGLGLGLLVDEAGLLLTEHSNYYSLSTYSLAVSIIALMLSIIFFPLFWIAVKKVLNDRKRKMIEITGEIAGGIENGGKRFGSKLKFAFFRSKDKSD